MLRIKRQALAMKRNNKRIETTRTEPPNSLACKFERGKNERPETRSYFTGESRAYNERMARTASNSREWRVLLSHCSLSIHLKTPASFSLFSFFLSARRLLVIRSFSDAHSCLEPAFKIARYPHSVIQATYISSQANLSLPLFVRSFSRV